MAGQTEPATRSRVPLSRERVLRAAVEVADTRGIGALTMRGLAAELGVEAMSLYYHVANKDELLDGVVEVVVDEINRTVDPIAVDAADPAGGGWKATVRRRILAARQVLLAHPWAPGVIESRDTMTPAVLRYFDALGGLLRQGGLSVDLVHHAMHALGSRALGFTQELFVTDPGGTAAELDAEVLIQQMADAYPHITEIVMQASHDAGSTLGWCDDQAEFEFGLDLILDGLAHLHATTT